jgi:hypothetical protein
MRRSASVREIYASEICDLFFMQISALAIDRVHLYLETGMYCMYFFIPQFCLP